jgi:transcriptional regulator with XRE-family HTH domain
MSKAFSERLRRVCDSHDNPDLRKYGRQALIAREMDVSEETARRWFSGMMAPRPDKMRRLAKFLGVDEVWLALGRDIDIDAKEQRALGRHVGGAVLFVRGLFELAGATTADASPHDPRGKAVDFYAVIDGRQMSVNVSFGRETDDAYLVPVPAEYEQVRCFSVLPYRANYLVLDMDPEMIRKHGYRKAGNLAVKVERAEGGGFISNGDEWPRLRPGTLPQP